MDTTADEADPTDVPIDDLGHPVFDADNHYYEALDAFTRHLDPALGPRCVQWCEIDGRQLPRARRPGQPGGQQPDVRPDRQARRHVRLLPGQPRRPQPAGVPGRARADPRRVPRPRRPRPALDAAGPRRLLAVPDPRHDLRGAAQGRPVRGVRHVPRLQPLAARGLGLRLRGPHLRRALPHAGRPGLGGRGAAVGARQRRPH